MKKGPHPSDGIRANGEAHEGCVVRTVGGGYHSAYKLGVLPMADRRLGRSYQVRHRSQLRRAFTPVTLVTLSRPSYPPEKNTAYFFSEAIGVLQRVTGFTGSHRGSFPQVSDERAAVILRQGSCRVSVIRLGERGGRGMLQRWGYGRDGARMGC